MPSSRRDVARPARRDERRLRPGPGGRVPEAAHQAFRYAGDTIARYEWTKDFLGVADASRYVLWLRPRVELTVGPVELGVGGAFNYSDDENDIPPEGQPLTIIRDNYRSRDARLDLAWGKLTLGPVMLVGGRFLMPIPFTEMIWDRDLRPQGGAARAMLGKAESPARFSVYGIYATGSHVFEDESAMYGGAGEISLGRLGEATLDFTGAYLQFDELNKLEPPIRRQNTRVEGLIVGEYKVVDLVGRLGRGGQLPTQLVFDYCWNTARDDEQQGPVAGGGRGCDRCLACPALLHLLEGGPRRDRRRVRDRRLPLGHGLGRPPRRHRGLDAQEELDPRDRPVAALQGRERPAHRRAVGEALAARVADELLAAD